MKNLTKSAKFSRYVGQFLTYFYMVVLSIIIIYPLLITVSSAFKAGNVTAFSLDLGMQWSLDNFTRLFNDGGPGSVGGGAGSTDILISWIYKITTGQSPQFSIAAALTLIISLIIISVSLFVFKKTNAFNIEEA